MKVYLMVGCIGEAPFLEISEIVSEHEKGIVGKMAVIKK